MSEPWIHELNDMLPSRWFIAFVLVSVPDEGGGAWSLVITRNTGGEPDSSEMSKELLEKLRSIKGQFVYNRLPVFYNEHCKGWFRLPGPNPDDNDAFAALLDKLSKPYQR